MRIVSLAFACSLIAHFVACAEPKIAAQREPESYVVLETQRPDAGVEKACLEGFAVLENPIYAKYSMLVLAVPHDRTTTKLASCLGNEWQPVPVTRTGSVLTVPTNELLVSFRPGVDPKAIQAFATQYNLTPLPSGLEKALNTYKFKTHQPAAASDTIVKQLSSAPMVDIAETNRITITELKELER